MSLGRGGTEKARVTWLAGLAAHDPAVTARAEIPTAGNIETSGLDARSHAMVRLAAAVTAGDGGEQPSGFEQPVSAALDHGVSLDEIAGIFVALLPTVGAERLAAAARAVLDCPEVRATRASLPGGLPRRGELPPASGRCS